MVAISFSEIRFVDLIRAGIKDQTIRPYNWYRYGQIVRIWKLQLYYKMRTKECFKIADAIPIELLRIRLYAPDAKIGHIQILDDTGWRLATKEEMLEFVRRDGFDTVHEFYKWFYGRYGERVYDMEFMAIRWKLCGGD